jgi:site-specific DNA recombinase
MLRRPRNAGLASYGDETFPAEWTAIVPETAWRAVVSILSNPERRTNTTGSSRVRWLGSGLYVCGICGEPALRVTHSGGGKRQPAYRCKVRDNTRQSGHVTRAAQQLDDYVERIIVARLQRSDVAELFTEAAGCEVDTTALHAEAAAIGHRPSAIGHRPSANGSPICPQPLPTGRSPSPNSAPAPTNSALALPTSKTPSPPPLPSTR